MAHLSRQKKSRGIVARLLTAGGSDTNHLVRRVNPVRMVTPFEAALMARAMARAKGRKFYTIAQLLRGRYVLRHKGKALRRHKLTGKGYLYLGVREMGLPNSRLHYGLVPKMSSTDVKTH